MVLVLDSVLIKNLLLFQSTLLNKQYKKGKQENWPRGMTWLIYSFRLSMMLPSIMMVVMSKIMLVKMLPVFCPRCLKRKKKLCLLAKQW